MALVLGTLLAVLCLAIVIIIRHRRLNRNAVVLTNWPVLGMLPGLFQNVPRLHDFVTEVLLKSRGTFEFKSLFLSNTNYFVTCDPTNIQHILNTNFTNYPKGPELNEVLDVLGDGILRADYSDLWRLQRKMFQLWNSQQSKLGFVSRVIQRKVVNDLIPFLDHVSEAGIQVDLQEVFQKMVTFDNAISLIFGLDTASHKFRFSTSEYHKAIDDVQETIIRRHFIPTSVWKLQRWFEIGGERKHRKGWEIFDEFLSDCLSLKREEFERRRMLMEEELDSDMISVYLEETENPHSDKFLKDVALNLAAASRDTFTSTLTWFFWLVATHPLAEAKILQEMEEKLPAKDDVNRGYFGAEELSKLVYLQAALHETLRLYPPVPINHRTAAEEDTLPSGHRVKPKQRVLLSFYSTGRMKEIWGGDCLEFKPERWIDSESGDRFVYVPPHKFPAFNAGPRTCLGKDVALFQTKVLVINVLRKYRLQVVRGHPISPTITVTLHMKHGLMVNVSKRG